MSVKKVLFASLLLSLILTSCFALQEPEEASGEIVAPTLEVAEPTEAPDPTAEPVVEEEVMEEEEEEEAVEEEVMEEEPAEEEVMEEEEAVEEEEVMEEEEVVEEEEVMEEEAPAGSATIFEIDPDQSEARFSIDEVLRGDPVTVVGVTNQVGGQIGFDLNDPAATQVGQILINARDLTTDNNFRNRAISNRILNTDEFEFISFTPTSIVGLPETVAVGDTVTFQIIGDLTITDVTNEVTFEVTATVDSESQLTGSASVVILYADWGLEIPFVEIVDSVEDEVTLEIDFVALAQ